MLLSLLLVAHYVKQTESSRAVSSDKKSKTIMLASSNEQWTME